MAALRDQAEIALHALIADLAFANNLAPVRYRDVSTVAALPAVVVQCVSITPHPPFIGGALYDATLEIRAVTNAHDDEDRADLEGLSDLISRQIDTITAAEVTNGLTDATCHGILIAADQLADNESNSRQELLISVVLFLHQTANDPTNAVLQLCFAGADGATTFTDLSPRGHVVTAVGAAQISTITDPFGGTDGVLYLDGASGLTVPSNADFAFGAADFTVEFWVQFTALGIPQTLVAAGGPASIDFDGWKITLLNADTLLWEYDDADAGGIDTYETFAWTPVVDTWYHVAISRSSGSLRAFVAGAQVGSTVANADDITLQSGVQIGHHLTPSEYATAYFDDVIITAGEAKYTEAFTPPAVGCS
jgi:hypothetical protein